MKRTLFIILILTAVSQSCSEDPALNGYSYFSESTIFSSDTSVTFREVLLVIRPFMLENSVKKYIVTDTLLNVRVKMNNTLWSVTRSLFLDTTAVEGSASGNFMVTDTPLKYSIIAGYQPQKDTLTTAGEYSELLRGFMIIEPGVYFCRVESFEFRMNDGNLKKVVPLISEMIEITEDTRSLFLGEFEVEIK